MTGLTARVGGRASGLAVAVGIGAAIVSAAPACASPDDTSEASTQTSAAESRTGPTRASHAAKRALPRGAAAEVDSDVAVLNVAVPNVAVLNTDAPKPAPRKTRTLRSQTLAAPAETQPQSAVETPEVPTRQLAVGRSAIATSGVNAASTASNPIHDLLATIFPWFDPRGQRITVFKGWQWSFPPQYALFVNKVSGHATFTPDSAYDVQGVDQYDWLKLTGITFTPWRPDTDAIMVAWRYNLDTEMFEIGPYYNSDLARIMPTEDQIISVPPDGEFDFSLDYNGITLTYGDKTVFKGLPESLHPSIWTAVRINGWFGGTSPAPRTISYYLHLNCF